MSRRAPPQPTLFLTREDQAVLDAAERYVLGPADGRKTERRHALQRAVLARWWKLNPSALARRRAQILDAA